MRSGGHTGLILFWGQTRPIPPDQLGKMDHSYIVARDIQDMCQDHALPEEIQLVIVECPLLTSSQIARLEEPIIKDTYDSMAKSRHASAVGVAMALDFMSKPNEPEVLDIDMRWSPKASCSSGSEIDNCQILVLSIDPQTPGNLRPRLGAMSGIMKDAIDMTSITDLLSQIPLAHPDAFEISILQVFVTAEACPTGAIRGNRHTMLTDSDIDSTRHARAAVGGLVAAVVNNTMIYVSGGAEGQGPPGGGSLCMIYSIDYIMDHGFRAG